MDMKWLLFSFDGRLNRQPWWVVVILMGLLNGGIQQYMYGPATGEAGAGGGIVAAAIAVLSLWISVAVHVKRWHDRDKSGWWVLIGLVPLLGWIWVLIECGFLRGTDGDNRFGRDPLAPGS